MRSVYQNVTRVYIYIHLSERKIERDMVSVRFNRIDCSKKLIFYKDRIEIKSIIYMYITEVFSSEICFSTTFSISELNNILNQLNQLSQLCF